MQAVSARPKAGYALSSVLQGADGKTVTVQGSLLLCLFFLVRTLRHRAAGDYISLNAANFLYLRASSFHPG